uniref:WD_REPEATS_REGION domain-containing protein n=1 Tax=Panagrellus redivivus TaxID=6233 RepID=A0A7E4V8Q8_PANRE
MYAFMFSKKLPPPDLTTVSVPTYALKTVGSRHILLGGGGGAAATGVKNELQLQLLTYNSFSQKGQSNALLARKTATIDTGLRSTMNMDVIATGPKDSGRFLVAAGQDDFCFFYESTGFAVSSPEVESDSPAQLSLNLKEIFKIKTDKAAKKAYQRCVRFDHSGAKPLRVATGGEDGNVRVWDASDIMDNRDPTIPREPIVTFPGEKGEVCHVDFSICGSLLVSVSNEVAIWSLSSGKKLATLPETPQIPAKKYRCRDILFVNLNPNRTFLIAGYNCRVRDSKQDCLLAIWMYDQEKREFRSYEVRQVDKDAIATMSLSACHNYIAIGTLSGSVHILDSRELLSLYSAKDCHGTFVTAVEFLPRRTLDTPAMGRIEQNGGGAAQTFLPGVSSDNMLSVVTTSVDNRVLLHSVPFPTTVSLTSFWLKSAAWLLLFYLLCWVILLK